MINPKLMPSNTHWEGQAGNLLNGTGKTSQISFYGIIKKMPVSHTIQIIGTVILRRNDGDLGSYYGGFPITNITNKVGISSTSKLVKDRQIGSCLYGTNATLNGYGGMAYLSSNGNVAMQRLYDLEAGAYGGWAWDTIGTQPVLVDWIIEYID